MDIYIKIALLLVTVIAVSFMAWDTWYKKRYHANLTSRAPECTTEPPSSELFDAVGPVRVVTSSSVSPPSIVAKGKNKFAEMSNKQNHSSASQNLLILSVMARPQSSFASYDLLQAIANTGLQFGEMNIFHYYHNGAKLFSLVSANKPGDFDMNNIGNFACTGLMLFMNINDTPDPQHAFKLMLDVAEQLTEDLDGILHADPLTPWSEKLAWRYQKKLFTQKSSQ